MISLSAYVFVAIYLVVDIIYVGLSKPVYNQAVRNISGKDISFEKQGAFVATMFAYTSMAVAWLFLAVPTVYYMISKGTPKWIAGMIAGAVYGIAIYGVFNGTLYAMFAGWDIAITTRDLLWGISWATVLTTLFAVTRR